MVIFQVKMNWMIIHKILKTIEIPKCKALLFPVYMCVCVCIYIYDESIIKDSSDFIAGKDFRHHFDLDYFILCKRIMMTRNMMKSQDWSPVLPFCFSHLLPWSSL